ncbi:hypothetical protein TPHA_0H01220 [Tetrapisispora phaffii CBS 4417]|uniref:Copper transport protein n=1 Tax=Tetrapisispora phaffii (strain ATCC 24235 / CBS 4417 / NBRC 1672 / NRRL Y-8282 / UCD 70-5) TaxID=1071381 RepID=G8BX26_TETPH|nr:hypothetical protein TPHA_0H01220 [Tetrapisispora phaffii CBS 4417]CCE64330.1 hypothetical protein TPHA_0H01220 [Tetrapisispora phaffii CBS 4417]
MDHSSHLISNVPDHSNHDHMDMGDETCSMNMIFTWDYKNVCVVFKWWHIRTTLDLVLSILAIAFLCYVYEFLKQFIHKKQLYYNSTLNLNVNNTGSKLEKRIKLMNSCYYGLQVTFSFMIMLIFMTYNGWLMLAILFGTIWGNYSWGFLLNGSTSDNSLACH